MFSTAKELFNGLFLTCHSKSTNLFLCYVHYLMKMLYSAFLFSNSFIFYFIHWKYTHLFCSAFQWDHFSSFCVNFREKTAIICISQSILSLQIYTLGGWLHVCNLWGTFYAQYYLAWYHSIALEEQRYIWVKRVGVSRKV